MLIEGWTLTNDGPSYDAHGEETTSATWTTIDEQARFYRINGSWRVSGETTASRQILRSAGIKASEDRELNLKEFVSMVSEVLGCQTRLKRGYTSYTLQRTHLSIAHIGDRRWHFVYGHCTDIQWKYQTSHYLAYQSLAQRTYSSRAAALRALNRELKRLTQPTDADDADSVAIHDCHCRLDTVAKHL